MRPDEVRRLLYLLIVYRYLKTFIIMAKFELKFLDKFSDKSYLTIDSDQKENIIFISGKDFEAEDDDGYGITAEFNIWLDKSTAIKFAKTLRTEINKIKEDVNNG